MISSEMRAHSFAEPGSARRGNWEFRYTAITDVGGQRNVNEDFYLLYPERSLYVIADGMGGHAAGEVAARITCETLSAYFEETGLPEPSSAAGDRSMEHHLIQAIKMANASVFEQGSEQSNRRGMGTTVVALTFGENRAHWAHVGDSRLYRLRDRHLVALTRDHSLLERTLENQNLTGDEARQVAANFPYRNILTRAVGSRYIVDVDVDSAPIKSRDLFVLTTDGVHDVLSSEEILDLLMAHRRRWSEACRAMTAEINRRGGPDNITIVCVEAVHRRDIASPDS